MEKSKERARLLGTDLFCRLGHDAADNVTVMINRRVGVRAAATVPAAIHLDHGPAVTLLEYDPMDHVVRLTEPDPDDGGPLALVTAFAYRSFAATKGKADMRGESPCPAGG